MDIIWYIYNIVYVYNIYIILLYPCVYWWPVRLFPCLSCYLFGCNDHGDTDISLPLILFPSDMPLNVIVGSMVVLFLILRNCHPFFHSGCTNFNSHQQYTSSPFSPHPYHQLLFLVFFFSYLDFCFDWGIVDEQYVSGVQHSSPQFLYFCLFMIVTLTAVRWHLSCGF